MIKALFFDLDGTLLNSERMLSRQTRLTLEKCKEAGIRLFIATARPPLLERMLSWDENTLSLFDGGVYYNGGCIRIDEQSDYQFVANEIVQKTINYVCEYDNLNVAFCDLYSCTFLYMLMKVQKKKEIWHIRVYLKGENNE